MEDNVCKLYFFNELNAVTKELTALPYSKEVEMGGTGERIRRETIREESGTRR